jgi:hypothetical protein
MKQLLLLLALVAALAAQTTRNATLTWTNSNPTGVVLGSVVSSSTSATGPFTQIGCVGTVAGSTCVSGSTATTYTYTDTPTVGTTVYYQVYFVGTPCTGTTPIGTVCGNSLPASTGAVPIPPRATAPGGLVVIVQ